MSRQITIITPENIPLTLEPAGLARRFGALCIDLFLQGCALGIVALIWAAFEMVSSGTNSGATPIVTAIAIILGFVVFTGYYILFELFWNGQTPGKRIFNLRVVRDNGSPVDFGAIAIRNFVRFADFLPVSYTAGAVTMFFHSDYKRLGDIVAGTLVIKEHESVGLPTFMKKRDNSATPMEAVGLPPGMLNPFLVLSKEELGLLRQFTARRWQMTSDDSERLAYRLVAPLVPRLNISFVQGAAPRYADLASALVAAADQQEAEEMI